MEYTIGGRYYKVKRGKTTRIAEKDFNKTPLIPRVGDTVKIIIKPYQNYVCKTGIVKRVLTKKKFHSRGHKVMLNNGVVGRTLKIIKRKT